MAVDLSVDSNEAGAERRCLLDVRGHLAPTPRIHYIDCPFEVPASASRIELALSFHKKRHAQVFVSLHDPLSFRGNRMRPAARGDICLDLWVAPDSASEGAIPGPLPAGIWFARIDIEGLSEETIYQLEVHATFDTVASPRHLEWPENHVVRAEAGWYKGELHAHSTESDGRYSVETVVRAAVDAGLDFLALTEHFTHSHWWKLAPLHNARLALVRSYEVTSHQGHANLHGLKDWVDVFVDRPGWSMDQVADAVHQQGGLFGVNHPFSGDLGWRAYEFDWDKADLLEIYHNLEGPNNNWHMSLWDHHLRHGRRLVGVGGIDSHDPFEGVHRLGQLVTWIEAPELSEQGLIAGLRRGRVYVSRGPELRFVARTLDGKEAYMWETLSHRAEPIQFEVQVKSDQPLRLFVLKNGYPFTVLPILGEDGWQQLQFEDVPLSRAYYRLEMHTAHPLEPYPTANWRDFSTMQVLSNPIWVAVSRHRETRITLYDSGP